MGRSALGSQGTRRDAGERSGLAQQLRESLASSRLEPLLIPPGEVIAGSHKIGIGTGDPWVAQSGKPLTLSQVMISQF